MTYEEIVQLVKDSYRNADAKTVSEHIAVQVNVTGEGAGAFYIEIADGTVSVEPYDYLDRDALLTVSAENAVSIAKGELTLQDAVDKGSVLVEGNLDKIKILSKIKIKAAKNAGAKKSVAKKDTAKKAVAKKAPKTETAEKKSVEKKAAVKETAAKKTAEVKTPEQATKKETTEKVAVKPETKKPGAAKVAAEKTAGVKPAVEKKEAKKTGTKKTAEEKAVAKDPVKPIAKKAAKNGVSAK